MDRKSRHPSERPIRRSEPKQPGFIRPPYDEPLTPGLRKLANVNAIGFTARLCDEADD